YLEALRVVVRTDPALFGEIAAFSHGRFATDRATYHISTTEAETSRLPRAGGPKDLERPYLDERPGRQLLHVTFGSVLTQGRRRGRGPGARPAAPPGRRPPAAAPPRRTAAAREAPRRSPLLRHGIRLRLLRRPAPRRGRPRP